MAKGGRVFQSSGTGWEDHHGSPLASQDQAAPYTDQLTSICELLISLCQETDQTIHAVLRNLVGELLLVDLNEPCAEYVDVIDAPSLRGLVETIVVRGLGESAFAEKGEHRKDRGSE
jgi:hypothetical protein